MDTQDNDLKQGAGENEAPEVHNPSSAPARGLRDHISNVTRAGGEYAASAGEAISQTSRDVRDFAASGYSRITSLANDAYQGVTENKGGLKGRALSAGKAALAGAGIAAASGLAVKGLKAAAKTKGLSALGRGNVAANLVDATLTVSREGYKLYRGESTKAEMAHACAEKGTGMIATAGGAGIGAMAAAALALPTGGASLVVGGASMLAGYAGPKVYQAGRKLIGDFVDKRDAISAVAVDHQDDVMQTTKENIIPKD